MTAIDLPPVFPIAGDEANHRLVLDNLVQKYVDFVYAAALRQVRDPHLAADVTQAVFLILQNKLPRLGKGTILAAWLLRTTRYSCLAALRQARQRRHHEQKAATMHTEEQQSVVPDQWSQTIDAALLTLGTADRTALAGVYFEGLSYQQVAQRLGVSTPTARKRVQRAVEKLRQRLARHAGRDLTATAVAGTLGAIGMPAAAPAAVLTGTITCLGGNTSTGVSLIVKGTLFMMKMLKVKMAALTLAVAGALALGSALLSQNTWGQQTTTTQPVATSTPVAIRPPASQPGGAFGPVMTLTIYDDGVGRDIFGDLDTGKTYMPPDEVKRASVTEIFAWIESQGIDLTYESGVSSQALLGIDMAVLPVETGSFDRTDPNDLMAILFVTFPGTPAIMTARVVPATYRFRTREGGVGVLELVKVNATPSSVEVRYKLLQPEVRNALAAQSAANSLLPDLEKQLQNLQPPVGALSPATSLRRNWQLLARTTASLAEVTRGTP